MSISVGCSPGDDHDLESYEIRRDGCRLGGARISGAIYLQHMVVEERAIRTNNGLGCLEPVKISVLPISKKKKKPPYSVMTQS